MVKFNIKEMTNELLLLVRTEEILPTPGLPPNSSQCIIMDKNELIDLKDALDNYANKGRNS